MKYHIKKYVYFLILILSFGACNKEESERTYLIIENTNITEGAVGTEVIIKGTGFSSNKSNNAVRFNGTLAKVTSSSSTSITTIVPIAASGNLTVTVNNEEAIGPHFTIPLDLIAYTSFEEVPTFVGDVFYAKTATVDLPNKQLTNSFSTDPYVDFTRTGNELGFDLSYDPTDIGDSGVERMGILSNENIETRPADFEARFQDGDQGFLMSDSDGTLVLTFDEITALNSAVVATIEMKVYVASATFEEGEGFQVFFKTEDGLGALIFDYFDDKAEEISGSWQTITASIPTDQFKTGSVVVKLKGSNNLEMVFIDSVVIKGL